MHVICDKTLKASIVFLIVSSVGYGLFIGVSDGVSGDVTIDNAITSNLLLSGTHDHVLYWADNRDEIKNQFNPYVKQFSSFGCIDHPELRKLLVNDGRLEETAAQAVIGSKNDMDAAYKLHKYVYASIEYVYADEDLTSTEVPMAGEGDCSEKSLLLVSLLDAAGIEAYVFDNNEHWYVFANIDGTWMPIDSTVDDFYYVYKNWNHEGVNENYLTDEQAFMFNEDAVLFNKDWCSNKIYV